jgi:DNA-directed RNA polymerase specialized sigma24 family protein
VALITVNCQGQSWQDDFAPLTLRLRTFFWRVFRTWREQEEMTNDAVLMFMDRFRKLWKPGQTITLTTNFVIQDVCNGRTFLRRPNQPSVKCRARRNLARLKARLRQFEAEVDFRLMLERLPEIQRQIVVLAVEGCSQNEIHKRLRIKWHKVNAALRLALSLLQG